MPTLRHCEKELKLNGMSGRAGAVEYQRGGATSHGEWKSVTEHTQDSVEILSLKTTVLLSFLTLMGTAKRKKKKPTTWVYISYIQ